MTGGGIGGFLKRVAGLFTRNWGLKLLALVLAILIYHVLKPNHSTFNMQDLHDRTFNQSS